MTTRDAYTGAFHRPGCVDSPTDGPLETSKDLEKAAQWFQKAGEQGHAEAPALLAGMHFSGEGLEKSFVQAYKWHGIAKGRGNIAATANQTEVAKLLTAEEKAATNKEVTAWLAAHPKKK